jgi:mono/diheme cytochrome c family protein
MNNVIALVILIAITASLVWAGLCAWRAKSELLRWGGAGLAALPAAALFLTSSVSLAVLKLHARSAPIPEVKVTGTSEQIERGHAIADSFCDACHSKTGLLTGGTDIGEHFPIRVGAFVSSNLTPAGRLRHWSDGELFRAIRNGIDAEGRWLIVMSYTNAGRLSDDDTKALIAYLRSLPPSGEATRDPPDQLNLLGVTLLGAGMLPGGKPIVTGAIAAPPKAPSAQYGEYILSYQDCRECHGTDLTGGVEGQLAPLGPDLNLVKEWKVAEFVATMRTGIDPGGHELNEKMPWRPIGKMDDDELTAIYEYLIDMPGPQTAASR